MGEKTHYRKHILYVFLLLHLFVIANNAYSQELEETWKLFYKH